MEKCSQLVIMIYRFGNFVYYRVKIPVIRTILLTTYKLINLFFVKLTFNTELPAECKIGKNLVIYHPYGIVVNKNVIIGANVILRHQTTIGNKGNGVGGVPHIGNNVNIGSGAALIGKIKIEDNVTIGAHSVVTNDVYENTTVVGVPAKVIKKN
ncbi:DapH/DapD/GlmU-related protein [Ligilactobacillus salivarius]|uniref:serine acetyltransferase n=1 Tax=Ligilactobacillus salivarius TaxID=1624 RepID=UPI003977CABA